MEITTPKLPLPTKPPVFRPPPSMKKIDAKPVITPKPSTTLSQDEQELLKFSLDELKNKKIMQIWINFKGFTGKADEMQVETYFHGSNVEKKPILSMKSEALGLTGKKCNGFLELLKVMDETMKSVFKKTHDGKACLDKTFVSSYLSDEETAAKQFQFYNPGQIKQNTPYYIDGIRFMELYLDCVEKNDTKRKRESEVIKSEPAEEKRRKTEVSGKVFNNNSLQFSEILSSQNTLIHKPKSS
jgi:hypothetical protein